MVSQIDGFSDILETLFARNVAAKRSNKDIKNDPDIRLFLEATETWKSYSRPHTGLVFEVLNIPYSFLNFCFCTIFGPPLHAASDHCFPSFCWKSTTFQMATSTISMRRQSRIWQNYRKSTNKHRESMEKQAFVATDMLCVLLFTTHCWAMLGHNPIFSRCAGRESISWLGQPTWSRQWPIV